MGKPQGDARLRLGTQPGGLGSCSHHVGEAFDGTQPAALLGASLWRQAKLKQSPYQHPIQQPFLLYQRKFGHSEDVDDTEMKWW